MRDATSLCESPCDCDLLRGAAAIPQSALDISDIFEGSIRYILDMEKANACRLNLPVLPIKLEKYNHPNIRGLMLVNWLHRL